MCSSTGKNNYLALSEPAPVIPSPSIGDQRSVPTFQSFTSGQCSASAPYEGAITHQPTGHHVVLNDGNVNIQQGNSNCPPELQILSTNDELLVCQKEQILEVSPGFNIRSKFTVENTSWQRIYYPIESSNFFVRDCFGTLKSSDMVILDISRREVIHLHRPSSYCCIFPSCDQTMEISAPPGTVVGTVQWEWRSFLPSFRVKDTNNDIVFWIEGPCFPWFLGFFTDVHFRIKCRDGIIQAGAISKLQSNLCTMDYNYKVSFPKNLDVRMKATLLGACFLIDALLFEKSFGVQVLKYLTFLLWILILFFLRGTLLIIPFLIITLLIIT